MTQSEKDLVCHWFDHLAQLAKDHKTLTGHVMNAQDCFDEMYVLAKGASEFVKNHGDNPDNFKINDGAV